MKFWWVYLVPVVLAIVVIFFTERKIRREIQREELLVRLREVTKNL